MVERDEVPNVNKTLFAVCDLSKDLSGKLKRFGGQPGIQILTDVTHYELPFPANNSHISSYFQIDFPSFFKNHTSSTASLASLE
jgi:hypothetical protein